MYKRCLIFICFGMLFNGVVAHPLSDTTVAGSPIEGITEYRLQNGLRVVVAPDDKAQVIAFNLVYLTGSLADRDGKGGTAHLLEHLLFKGTTKLPGTQLVDEMKRRGIQFNATTSYDRTRYQAILAADAAQLDWLLAMEADRMVNARFDQADLDKEIPVVLREMEIAQSNAIAALSQRLIAVEDPHRYGRHPLGTRGEVEKLTLKGVRDFYQAYYRPDNAVLVLSGNFDASTILSKVQQHFGYIKTNAPKAAISKEPSRANNLRQVSIQRGETSIAALAYPIPAAAAPLGAEFGVLMHVLGGNPHGRLHQALVNQGKAVAIVANTHALDDFGMFFFMAALGEGQPSIEIHKHMSDIVEQLDRQPITEQELQRAKKIFSNFRVQLLADPIALGNVLAENAGAGDWRLFFRHTDRVARLNIADVQRAAASYLKSATRISGELIAQEAPQRIGSENVSIVAPISMEQPKKVASKDDQAIATSSVYLIKDAEIDKLEASIQRLTLKNGLNVALLPKPTSGNRVQGRLNLRFGDEKSLFGKRQIADLTAAMLTVGTRTSSQQQLADRLNNLGARIAVVPEDDHVSVRFETPRTALPAVLELITEVLREPIFPESEFDTVRQQLETNLKHQRSTPEVLATEELTRRSNPYPQGDARRPPAVNEAMAALDRIKRQDVVRFHADYYGADHGELAVVGDFDAAELLQRVESLLGNWKNRAGYRRPPRPFHSPIPGTFSIATPGKAHGQYLALLRLPLRDDSKEASALALANQILGGTPVGARLTERLRNEEGFSYSTGTKVSFSAFDNNGSMTIAATYPPAQRIQMQVAVHEELARLVKEGITASELQQAKNTLIQQNRQARRNDGALVNQLLLQLRTGRSMQSLAEREAMLVSITVDDVNAVIRHYLELEKLVEVLADANVDEAHQQVQHE